MNDKWIDDLMDYFGHNRNVPVIKIDMLFKVFGNNETSVLERAAYLYMVDEIHFPSVANFKPYVEMAAYDKPKLSPLQNVKAMTESQIEELDNKMYEFESERGSMRPLGEIETEIDEARIQLKEMRLQRAKSAQ